MIIDHSLALILLEKPKIRYLKIDSLKKKSGKMLNISTDFVKSDHHKAVNQASESVERLEQQRSKVKISVFENFL